MAKVTDRRNSELAAATERSGDYRKAWELWDKAAGETTDHKHRIWCINRAEFCNRVAIRPISQGESK